ncbi:hypothetical protein QLL95_gp0652 [Cotonvirus japonicus]|uniref:Uncharacterized protein n=1 Tax=Cotonvirus japonicus TaxID=2811091 RepID=A0ABM7NTP9_9VIRU|nr:hypothetical protein QLL95_gp0652 [Cotonvirus japonicus]BCS83471.1 hypothetical protein [Cotonvirus japonicus]
MIHKILTKKCSVKYLIILHLIINLMFRLIINLMSQSIINLVFRLIINSITNSMFHLMFHLIINPIMNQDKIILKINFSIILCLNFLEILMIILVADNVIIGINYLFSVKKYTKSTCFKLLFCMNSPKLNFCLTTSWLSFICKPSLSYLR